MPQNIDLSSVLDSRGMKLQHRGLRVYLSRSMARKQKRSQAQQVKGFSGFMYRSVVYTSHVLFQTSSRMLCNSFSPPKNDTTRSKATVSAQQVETLESSTHKKNSAMHVHRRRLAWS
ncbi:predicted protein [Sclerotinia sclerotiorum 1980 UF-70]|uniref:Uncharacterized protein n=1 Tax=Sclerotinia sclerotiorum (strain ATCC 18683 / 1980 / Ss-1) TaxID=665079 RepID=A7E3Z1_SCLS1|nr:predicted protein [Sclerotinia sclerotiorum 1980 UF-70]EDN90613.1 predicted protein [Sclerotinia sclerotiorum 1980 UF-70]